MNYGLELEFFVSNGKEIIPAYLATNNLDGDPFLGELRTTVHNNILDAVYELKKLIHKEQMALTAKGYAMVMASENLFSKSQLVEFRKDARGVSRKELDVLEQFSIYPTGAIGKILKRGLVKASLHVNMSVNKSYTNRIFDNVSYSKKPVYVEKTEVKYQSEAFNYVQPIQKLDAAFADDIKRANRVKGVYAIKPGVRGTRVEYRSLPNTIDLNRLIEILS